MRCDMISSRRACESITHVPRAAIPLEGTGNCLLSQPVHILPFIWRSLLSTDLHAMVCMSAVAGPQMVQQGQVQGTWAGESQYLYKLGEDHESSPVEKDLWVWGMRSWT